MVNQGGGEVGQLVLGPNYLSCSRLLRPDRPASRFPGTGPRGTVNLSRIRPVCGRNLLRQGKW